uniref:AB hydrolase-1 domain-containing protein n=2 Tax=Macrostomum lignano TaxID=282301 RepID=A0A1I8GFE8_9PLAT
AAVVLVPGLMGWGPEEMETPHGQVPYWDTGVAEDTDSCGLPLLQASVGPVSSQHDRACELFAQMLGLRTDFGAEHSAEFGHDRWGSDFSGRPGLWPDWGPDSPCHFVGHSAGGNTIRLLQHLLATDFWGRGTSAAWVKSVTCIASPLNGSTATYLYGSSRDTGLFQWPSLVPLVSCVELIETLQGVPSERRGRLRHWRLEHWGVENEDFRSYSRLNAKLRGPSRVFLTGKDNLSYDISLEGALELNGRIGADQPDCHYLSVLTCCTSSALGGFVRPSGHCGAFLLLPCAFMCAERVDHRLPGADVADWRHNDGLVPLGSQRMPFFGAKRPAPIQLDGDDGAGGDTPDSSSSSWRLSEAGRWHCVWANRLAGDSGTDWDHNDPVFGRSLIWEPPRQRWSFTAALLDGAAAAARWLGLRREGGSFAKVARDKQKTFYERLYRLLAEIP